MRLSSPLQAVVTVVYESKTPALNAGESGGNRTVTPCASVAQLDRAPAY